MSRRIGARIPEELARSLDELVASGRFETKADAVRSALKALVESERRRRIGQLIADGYRRLPQDDEELGVITSAALRSIREEPWVSLP